MGKERKGAKTLVARPGDTGNIIIDPRKVQHHRKIPSRETKRERAVHRREPGFSPEHDGRYSVTREGGTRDIDRTHGRVINKLAHELSGMGIKVSNTGLGGDIRPDLVALTPPMVFEVKTQDNWSDVFCGIGQVLAYSDLLGGNKQAGRVLVVPASIAPEKTAVLSRLGIRAVKWRERDGEISFARLRRALPKQPG